MHSSPNVDIVIPAGNTRDLTLACLDSLLGEGSDQSDRPHVIVVENATTDGTAETIETHWSEVTLLRSPNPIGFGRANNWGAREGSAPYILLLNSDIVAHPGAVRRLVEFMEESPEHVAAGGRLVDLGTDRTQVGFNLRAFPRLWAQVALMAGLERYWPANPISRRQLMLDFDYRRTQDTEQPAGACLICRRADFEALGGFDENFFMWFEDVDLCWRLRERGRIAYVHEAVFEHAGSAGVSQWTRAQTIVTRYRSLIRYFAKHRTRGEQLTLRLVIALLAAVRVVGWAPIDRSRARAYATVVGIAVRGGPLRQETL